MSLGLFELGRIDWPVVRSLVVAKGSHRLLHVPPAARADLARAAAAAGLAVYARGANVVEIRLKERRGGSAGPRMKKNAGAVRQEVVMSEETPQPAGEQPGAPAQTNRQQTAEERESDLRAIELAFDLAERLIGAVKSRQGQRLTPQEREENSRQARAAATWEREQAERRARAKARKAHKTAVSPALLAARIGLFQDDLAAINHALDEVRRQIDHLAYDLEAAGRWARLLGRRMGREENDRAEGE